MKIVKIISGVIILVLFFIFYLLQSPTLLIIKNEGGDCESHCIYRFFIKENGLFIGVSGYFPVMIKLNDRVEVKRLKDLVEITNFETIRSVPSKFCPTELDLSEKIYIFSTSHGTETISECKTMINWESPIFKQVKIITSS